MQIRLKSSKPTFFGTEFVCQKTCATTVLFRHAFQDVLWITDPPPAKDQLDLPRVADIVERIGRQQHDVCKLASGKPLNR